MRKPEFNYATTKAHVSQGRIQDFGEGGSNAGKGVRLANFLKFPMKMK